jgi:hypothetical protein
VLALLTAVIVFTDAFTNARAVRGKPLDAIDRPIHSRGVALGGVTVCR